MKIVVFTSNAVRHKYVANTLAEHAEDTLVVSECKTNDAADTKESDGGLSPIEEHFHKRYEAEQTFFSGNDWFAAATLPLLYREADLAYTYESVKRFEPDLMFVFGASLLKDPLLSLLDPGRFINLHLGLSPYYRGSGTNFWPFVNEELEYVGSTLLHIDSGIDTGEIVAHVRPQFEPGDNVHTIGCKVIRDSATCMVKVMDLVRTGKALNRVEQWQVSNDRYYRNKDFNEEILQKYLDNLDNGLIEKYLEGPQKDLRLVSLVD